MSQRASRCVSKEGRAFAHHCPGVCLCVRECSGCVLVCVHVCDRVRASSCSVFWGTIGLPRVVTMLYSLWRSFEAPHENFASLCRRLHEAEATHAYIEASHLTPNDDAKQAKPQCALQDMAGRKFCALMCNVSLPTHDQVCSSFPCLVSPRLPSGNSPSRALLPL